MNNDLSKIEALKGMIVWAASVVEEGLSLGKDVSAIAANAERNARRIAELQAA